MNYLPRLLFTLFFICSLGATNENKIPDISENCIDTYIVAPEDIFDLQAAPYFNLVTGNDYTAAINLAIQHANNPASDPNSSGAGAGALFCFQGTKL
ncbi:MAG: hypothetical protein ACI9Y7_002716 [Dokdonia sp.]|jgi:hypothetical protein